MLPVDVECVPCHEAADVSDSEDGTLFVTYVAVDE